MIHRFYWLKIKENLKKSFNFSISVVIIKIIWLLP